jgi:hypothetical protein
VNGKLVKTGTAIVAYGKGTATEGNGNASYAEYVNADHTKEIIKVVVDGTGKVTTSWVTPAKAT